jgi:hypothetical protein
MMERQSRINPPRRIERRVVCLCGYVEEKSVFGGNFLKKYDFTAAFRGSAQPSAGAGTGFTAGGGCSSPAITLT